MAKDPSSRYATAAALGEELREVQRQLGHRVDNLPVIDAPAGHRPGDPAAAKAAPGGPQFIPTYMPPPPPAPTATMVSLQGKEHVSTMDGRPGRGVRIAVLSAVAMLLAGGGAFVAGQLLGGGDPETPIQAQHTTDPPGSSAPPARRDETTSPAQKASASGPAMLAVTASGLVCKTFANGRWNGQANLKWQANDLADNVQLSAPAGGGPVGGFDGRSGETTVDLSCTPGGTLVISALPQKGSKAGQRKDYRFTWPAVHRVTNFSVLKLGCPRNPSHRLSWTSSDGTTEVRIYMNDKQFTGIVTSPDAGTDVFATCTAGSRFTLRATAYKNGVEGGSHLVEVTVP